MKEYIIFAFSGINLIPSVLLILVAFYWLMTILGFISNDVLDFDFGLDDSVDFDLDIDADIDIDVDVDTDLNLESGGEVSSQSIFFKILKFSNIGSIPFMVYVSIFTIFLWALSMMTYYFNTSTASFFALGLFVVNLVGSFLLTKVFTNPIVPFFEGLEDENKFEAIGQKGKLTTNLDIGRLGTLLISLPHGREILLNVKCEKEAYKKGDICKVIRKVEDRDIYIIEKVKGE